MDMSSTKPLKMGVCGKCQTKFFVGDPTPGPNLGGMTIHDVKPPQREKSQVVEVTCPACQHVQFAEFQYGR
jgi:hypothetical protein